MMRGLAVLGLALGLLGAPALALAAVDACPPCCDHASPTPCEMPCDEQALQDAPCCEAPQAADTAPVKRGVDASVAVPIGVAGPTPPALASRPASIASHWWLRPARLSVVRRL